MASTPRRMTRGHFRAGFFLLVTVFLVSATPVDARQETPTTGRFRVTVIGIDGATWRVIDPLLATGELPHMARFIESGVRGPLRSRLPLYSAPVWTTVATGVLRERHGIVNFHTHEGRLSASVDRRSPALWTLASREGLSSAVIGWWATYPAESIEGVIVSERALKTRDEDLHALDGSPPGGYSVRLVHPSAAGTLVSDLLVDLTEDAPGEGEKAAIVHRMRAEDAAVVSMLHRFRSHMGLFDLEMILLRGIDPISHHFWKFFDPSADEYGEADRPSPEEVTRYGRTVEDHYRYVDSLLGEVSEAGRPDQVVMLLSDHGFEAGQQPFRGGVLSGKHGTKNALHGIFVATGGPIRKGERLERLTIFDVAPTVLHLLGLPVAESLAGRVLLEIFEPGWAASHPVRSVSTYPGPPVELSHHPGERNSESPVDEELRKQLRALGYID